MNRFFRRTHHNENLMVTFDDGKRVIVKNHEGNVAVNCSRWLYDTCWKRGLFVDY